MKFLEKKSAFETADNLLIHTYDVERALQVCNRILTLTRIPEVRWHYTIVRYVLLLKKYTGHAS